MEDRSLQRNVLIVATLGSFLTPFMASSVIVALPSIASGLSMKVITMSWVSTAYLLAAAAFSVPFGRASDIYGRKRLFTWGMVGNCVTSLVAAFAQSSAVLIVARVFQGISGAMIFTLGMTIVTSVFPPEKRGKALGIIVAAVYVGLSVGPLVGGFLTNQLGWRSIFLTNVLVGVVVVVVTLWKLKPEWADARGERFDYAGSVAYVISLAVLMYGLSEIPAPFAYLLVGLGILGLVVFAIIEGRVKHPVFETKLLGQNRGFLFSNLAALINYSATFGATFLMSLYLHYIKGYSAQMTGLILVSQPLMQAIFSPMAGRLSDRLDPRIVASLGMALTVIGLVIFACLTEATGMAVITGNLMLLGFGFALFSSPNSNAIMSSVEKRYLGIAGGTLATMRVAGQMFSMGIVMLVFGLFRISGVIITPSYYVQFLQSTRVAFAVSAALCAVGVFASLWRGKRR